MTNVIYHRSDFDGLFCQAIAKKFLGDNANYYGLEYGDPLPPIDDSPLFILDFSVPEYMNHPRLTWIDHHKTAIEKFGSKQGFQLDGVAACRLAWQYFTIEGKQKDSDDASQWPKRPEKQDFIDRIVLEPWSVRLAGEYDVWDKRDPNAELFQHGLRSEDLDWIRLLNDDDTYIYRLLEQGKALQYSKSKENASIIKEIGFTIQWEGLTFLCCNAARYNSLLFTAGLLENHDACFGFKWTGKDWSISLYHAPGKEHHDLSIIASKYGGGGHKGACGFRTKELPFLIQVLK